MNTKAFQLSINMFVVLVISLLILGMGFSLFARGADTVTDLTSQLDAQTESQLDRLLDDGSRIVVPQREATVNRGDMAVFTVGVSNELGGPYNFYMPVTYATVMGLSESSNIYPVNYNIQFVNSLPICIPSADACPNDWIVLPEASSDFMLENNERHTTKFGIQVPSGIPKGQYAFNIDVCQEQFESDNDANCEIDDGKIDNRYATRIKVYVNVE